MEGRTGYVAYARLFTSSQGKKAGLIEKQLLQDKAKSILSELNNNFRNNYHKTFTKQVKQVLEIPKPKDSAKLIKTDIENQWEETCVERYVKLFSILLQSNFHPRYFSHRQCYYVHLLV